jgi:hypothetical protein
VKNQLLEELTKKSFATRDDPPVNAAQRNFVKLLMNSSMKRFDFATCGAVQVGGEADIWKCLLPSASSLTSIEDSRVNKDVCDRLMVRPLNYILQFKNLEKLVLKSYFSSDGTLYKEFNIIYISIF